MSTLLGCKLKDDAVLEVLEAYGAESVTYDFDRNHENMEDSNWAAAHAAGFQLRFNQDQVLDTVFCYIAAAEGFSAISPRIIGAPIYSTFDEAEAACRASGATCSVAGTKFPKLWIRVETSERYTHYQFTGGELSLLTLMLPPD